MIYRNKLNDERDVFILKNAEFVNYLNPMREAWDAAVSALEPMIKDLERLVQTERERYIEERELRIKFSDELKDISIELNAYHDSNLSSLAKTLRIRNEHLEEANSIIESARACDAARADLAERRLAVAMEAIKEVLETTPHKNWNLLESPQRVVFILNNATKRIEEMT